MPLPLQPKQSASDPALDVDMTERETEHITEPSSEPVEQTDSAMMDDSQQPSLSSSYSAHTQSLSSSQPTHEEGRRLVVKKRKDLQREDKERGTEREREREREREPEPRENSSHKRRRESPDEGRGQKREKNARSENQG